MVHRVQSEQIDAPFYEVRAASTANGGTALTTTFVIDTLPLDADWVSVTPRNFAGGATVVKFALTPKLNILKTTDTLATLAGITDLTDEAQDGDATGMELDSFGLSTSGEYIYMGSDIPFAGVKVIIGAANATASNLTVEYWTGSDWRDISDTDATDTGASFAVSGDVTWTIPSAWVRTGLQATAVTDATVVSHPKGNSNFYWVRFSWNAAHDSNTEVDEFLAINRSTAYAELAEGQTFDMKIPNTSIIGVQALTDAGTANVIINVATAWGDVFN